MTKAVIVIRHRTNNILTVIKHQHALKGKEKEKSPKAGKPKTGKKMAKRSGKKRVL